MPKRQRANGAGRPFRYEAKWKSHDKDGNPVIKSRQRWKQQIYVGYYPDGRPRKRTFTGDSAGAVTAKVRVWRKELQENDGIDVDRRTSLGDYSELFLSKKKQIVDPKSYRMYTNIVHNHLADYLDRPISAFTPSSISHILGTAKSYDRKGKVTGSAGISLKRQIRSTLHSIFEDARRDRMIPTNPAQGVPIPQSKDANYSALAQERTAFSVPEMEAMLRAAAGMEDKATGVRMWFRLLTGMRQGEIIGARIPDLRLYTSETVTYESREVEKECEYTDADGQIRKGKVKTTEQVPIKAKAYVGEYSVNWKLEEVQKDHGCGKETRGGWPCGKKKAAYCPDAVWRIPEGFDMIHLRGRWCLTHPKSLTGRRVPIIPILAQVLKQHLDATKRQPNPFDLLFHHADGSMIQPKEDMADFRQLMEMAHIPHPETHSGHETRHSVVTLLASMGVDAQLIKEIVGHSSDAMVEHYRHANDAERLKAMETLDESLGLEQIGWSRG